MKNISIDPEDKGLLISLGIVIAGNIIKPRNRDIGNMVQGFGLGTGIGTIAHILDSKDPDHLIPHHDLLAIISLPTTFILYKTGVIKNKDMANNLYGIGLGFLTQHLVTEGCSICGTYYCHDGEKLC